jgi:hypothetical protein
MPKRDSKTAPMPNELATSSASPPSTGIAAASVSNTVPSVAAPTRLLRSFIDEQCESVFQIEDRCYGVQIMRLDFDRPSSCELSNAEILEMSSSDGT